MGTVFEKIGFNPTVASLLNKFFQSRRNRIAIVGGLGTALVAVAIYRRRGKKNRSLGKSTDSEDLGSRRRRGITDKKFLSQLLPILRVVLPGVKSKEFLILVLHTVFLVSRTFLSIYVASLDGRIVKSLVNRDGKQFLSMISLWVLVGLPATYVNSMIKYLESKLFIGFRTRLSEYAYELYMKNETYYRVGNLDSRISNADQCLTEDVSRFCEKLAHLHSQLSKPILDVVLMTAQLWKMANEKGRGSGFISATIATTVIWLTARILKLVQPPFGRLAAQQAHLEGDLRFVHSRLITNAEEVAFYRGHEREQSVLHASYTSLVKHLNTIFSKRIFYNMMEGFFMKYVWSASGLSMIAVPVFLFEKKEENASSEVISTRAQDYTTSKNLLISGAEAIERIMLALKEINEFAGYTERVSNMIQVFKDVAKGEYKKVTVSQHGAPKSKVIDFSKRGHVEEGDYILFENVPIVSPNGDVLVPRLTFQVRPNMHLLISGPNGCGKSSLFRILGGLWPIFDGKLIRPRVKDMFYIPQRPYLVLGTLRDQVIYPDTVEDLQRMGKTDKDLEEILGWVHLLHILQREGGWDSVKDWKDILSGGEKQRVGMARLFYHMPKYAILDECTSAVSIDVEGKMYQKAIDLGITLMTVTHRPSLWKYHNHILQFDGEGGWQFSQLNADTRMSLKEEKSRLESSLSGIPKMQDRLRELCQLLGEDSVVLQDPHVKKSVAEQQQIQDGGEEGEEEEK